MSLHDYVYVRGLSLAGRWLDEERPSFCEFVGRLSGYRVRIRIPGGA